MSLELLERISPDQRLLLQTVLFEDDRAQDAFRQWRELVVIDHIDRESQRLMPLLARRLEEVGPNDPVRALVRGMYRHAWVKNQLIIRDAGSLAAALRRRGVPALALKGAALVPYYGGDWGSRPMFDVDLLVPVAQLPDAVAVLNREGWHPQGGQSTTWLLSRIAPRRHSFAFSREPEHEIDLHWHVLGGSLGDRADDRFWANAVPFELAGVDVLALDRPDLLLHVLVHGTRDKSRGYVQWVADAVHVLRSADDPNLAERLSAAARIHGQVTTVRAGLETITRLLDEPRVEPLLAQLSRTRPALLERMAVSGSQPATGLRRAVASVLRHGGSGGSVAPVIAYARSRLELDLIRRPAVYVAYVASGRRTSAAALCRRFFGTFVRTPTGSTAYSIDREIDFTAPEAGDDYATLGWDVDERGLSSRGREARIVLDVQDRATGDLDLFLDLDSPTDRSRIELRVNEKIVTRLELVRTDAPGEVRIRVPADVAWRFRPMEIAMLAAPNGRRLRRGRVDVRLRRLRVARCR